MMLKGFAIYDTKTLAYGVPFFMPSIGGAVRAFGDLACDPQSTVSKHPKDYILYEIGYYDDSKGILASTANPRNLGFASDFIPPVPGAEPEKAESPVVEMEEILNKNGVI